MKIFLFLIGMGAAGILGYSFEPQMRFQLTGKTPVSNIVKPQMAIVEIEAPPEYPDPAPVDPNDMADNTQQEPTEVTPEPEIVVAEPEPVPEPAPEPEPVPEPFAPKGAVAVMQSSIKGGDIKEFSFDQVIDWQAGEEPETIDGVAYQTGIASYKSETVFGLKTIQAKALINGGKVVRWLWPKSGMEIK